MNRDQIGEDRWTPKEEMIRQVVRLRRRERNQEQLDNDMMMGILKKERCGKSCQSRGRDGSG